MPREAHPWFRYYVETIGDRKIRRLDFEQRWIWSAMLAAAADSPVRGLLLVAEDVPMTAGELAEFAGVKERKVRDTLSLTTKLRMTTVADGLIRITNWDKRQFESDNVTKRTRAFKERSKEQGKERSHPVPGNVRRNGTEAETETDEEANASSRPRKRATRLPDDWKPSPADVEWQRAKGISDLLARRAFEKFANYWRAKSGKDAAKLDWSATWRNWLLTEQERAPRTVETRPAVPEW